MLFRSCVCVCVCTCVCTGICRYVTELCISLCRLSMGTHRMTPFFETSVTARTTRTIPFTWHIQQHYRFFCITMKWSCATRSGRNGRSTKLVSDTCTCMCLVSLTEITCMCVCDVVVDLVCFIVCSSSFFLLCSLSLSPDCGALCM